jgi:hypothetical protein
VRETKITAADAETCYFLDTRLLSNFYKIEFFYMYLV